MFKFYIVLYALALEMSSQLLQFLTEGVKYSTFMISIFLVILVSISLCLNAEDSMAEL